jgi:FeS assembly SUF system protein
MPQKLAMPENEAKRLSTIERSLLESEVVEAIRLVYDPEIPVNVYDLGLIYDVSAGEAGFVDIVMTLTSPACPVAGTLPGEVEDAAREVAGVTGVRVELTWDPPFTIDRMSDEVKLLLGLL